MQSFYIIIGVLITYLLIRFMLIPLIRKRNQMRYLLKHGRHTIGTIIDISSKKDADGLILYTSIIEFQGMDGAIHKTESKFPTTIKGKIGKKVDLYYNESNPQEIITSSFINRIVLLLAILFCIGAVGLITYYLIKPFLTVL
jgi:hypothetical protein